MSILVSFVVRSGGSPPPMQGKLAEFTDITTPDLTTALPCLVMSINALDTDRPHIE